MKSEATNPPPESTRNASRGFLVAISPSPYSQYIIRWTKKMAQRQQTPWLAVYIQTVRTLSDNENALLNKNMKLVNELGAELIVSLDDNIPRGIIRLARQHDVSHIVIGKPLGYNSSGLLTSKNMIDELIRMSGEIDVFVVSEQTTRPKKRGIFSGFASVTGAGTAREYALVCVWLTGLTGLNLFLHHYISYLSIGFIFLAAVSIISSRYKRGPVLFFAALSALLWNFLFLQPRFTFYIDHLEDLLMFLMYFITAFIIGNLTSMLRVKELFLRKREKNLEELYLLSKILNKSNSLDEVLNKSMDYLGTVFSIQTAILLRDDDGRLSPRPLAGSDLSLSDEDWNAARWCFENGAPAGKNTENHSSSGNQYIPLQTLTSTTGVLALRSVNWSPFSIDQENLLSALLSQISTAIERNEHQRTQQKIKLAEESEKLYRIMLNSVSHELRTPITTISTAANGLMDESMGKNSSVREIFANDIVDASDRLNRIVDNLLGSLRIESDRIALNLQWYDISELASTVCKKLEKQFKNHPFILEIAGDLPMVKFDFMLMDQLLTNLLHNAVLHTPSGSEISLVIGLREQFITLAVNDNGNGIPEGEREKIFTKFYRPRGVKPGGLGLGLSICREIAEIHNGTIRAEKNARGGASFIVDLPLEQSEIRGELR